MTKTLVIGGCALALAASSLSAQQFIGFAHNLESGATSRGAIAGGAGEVMTRIDASDYAGWANDPSNVQNRLIRGVSCIVQDQDAVLTPETFNIKFYREDPARPGYPLLSSGVMAVTGVAGPAAPPSGVVAATYHSITFATPVSMPVGADTFVAFAVPANNGWFGSDGLSFHFSLGYQPNASYTVFDLPGAAMGPLETSAVTPASSYALSWSQSSGVMAYSTRRQMIVDLASDAAGGVITASTNQGSYISSNGADGTASFMSALHPDAVNPAANVGRADNIGYRFEDTSLADNSPVFYVAALGSFAPELSLSLVVPGSSGAVALNMQNSVTFALGLTSLGGSQVSVTVPAGARNFISGWPLLQQAVAYDGLTGTLHAAPAGRQVF